MGYGMNNINYDKIYSKLDKITGLPLKQKGYKWFGACYINGSPHQRWNKVVARQTKDGNIQILEQGLGAISLWNWMLEYGGCTSSKEVYDKLVSESDGVLIIPERIEPKSRYVGSVVSESRIENDNLFKWMCTLFDKSEVSKAFSMFSVTSTMSWAKVQTTTFWYIDFKGRICHDKQVLYGNIGKRDKKFGGGRNFKSGDGFMNRCYYGEHLFGNIEDEKVYIVESEKTALLFWLKYKKPVMACGGLNNLMKIKSNYVLLADVDGYSDWYSKYPSQCVKWWESYKNVGKKDDIGDLIVKDLELEKLLLSL